MSNPAESRAVERVILVNIKAGISETQLNIVAQHGKESLGAIPGVEQVSFGTALHVDASYRCYVRIRFHDADALQVYETHPNHAAFGLQEWLPIIADEILVDYVMTY
ncbi:MAG: Dabb family protein [Anaerolineales bacterium]